MPADPRARAVRWVTRLIEDLRGQAVSPGYRDGHQARIAYLTRELGLMQSDSPEGATLAGRWALLIGDHAR